MVDALTPTSPCNVLLSAAGRRVHLLRLIERTLRDLRLSGTVFATDVSLLSSAIQVAVARAVVLPYADPQCLNQLLGIVKEQAISLIIPTIDPELPFYAQHRASLEAAGCHVNVSSPECIEIAKDKRRTHEFLIAAGIATPTISTVGEFRDGHGTLPAVVKPRSGSASIGVRIIHRPAELDLITDDQLLVQAVAPGDEYTVDVFVDQSGQCRCAVPRLRLETRAGEVSKAVSVRNPQVASIARATVEALPGARGVLNVQVFDDKRTGATNVIEINPRFGGGYPLSHQAGAPMIRWLLEEILGMPSSANDDWREGVVMLRYDDAVFTDATTAGLSLSPFRDKP